MNYRFHDSASACRRGVPIAAKVGFYLLMMAVAQTVFISSLEAQYLTPSGVTFSATAGAGAPPSQTITLNPVSTSRLRMWTASTTASWLQVSPKTGDILHDTDTLTVTVNTSGMSQGIYTDTIPITLVDPNGVIRTTSTSVTLNLTGGTSTSAPSIALSPASLSFTGTAGGSVPAPKTMSLTNPGGGRLSWNITPSAPWLVVTPTTGTTSTETDTISVTANTAGLAEGSYSEMLTIGGDGLNAPQQVMVNLTLSGQSAQAPALSVSPSSLTASLSENSTSIYVFDIVSTGGGELSWAAKDPVNWLTKDLDFGTAPGKITVTLDSNGLAQGTYQTTLTISASGVAGSPVIIPVTMTVGTSGAMPSQTQAPHLSVSPSSLAVVTPVGSIGPLTYHVNISNSGGGGSLQWTVKDPVNWFAKKEDFGMTPAALEVYFYPEQLPPGIHSTSLSVILPGASNSPLTIPVSLTVGSPGTASATLSWSGNSESDLAGYKIHYGTSPGGYTNFVSVGNVTTYTLNGLSTGRTYYFAVSAIDKTGNESGPSGERSIVR